MSLGHFRPRTSEIEAAVGCVRCRGVDMTRVDDEIECPGCHALVDVARPLGVELRVIEAPSYTSEGGSVTSLSAV